MEASFDDIARDGDVNNELRLALSKALSTKAARLRYEAFLERAPAFIAAKVKRQATDVSPSAISAWEQARELAATAVPLRSEEHTSELQSLMRISYAVFCLKQKTHIYLHHNSTQ